MPRVVDNQCLLSAQEFSALVGRQTNAGENISVTRSGPQDSDCFYAPVGQASAPVGRIDVYGSDGPPPPELLQRITGKVAGSRPLAGVARAAVIVSDSQSRLGADLWVATDRYLVQIHLFNDTPDDVRWSAAGTAAANKLPS